MIFYILVLWLSCSASVASLFFLMAESWVLGFFLFVLSASGFVFYYVCTKKNPAIEQKLSMGRSIPGSFSRKKVVVKKVAAARTAGFVAGAYVSASSNSSVQSDEDSSLYNSSSYGDLEGNNMGILAVNPANGLPMIGGVGGVDVEGNPYGSDNDNDLSTSIDDSCSFNSFDESTSCSSFDDSFTNNSFDDSFSSSSFDDPW